MKKSLLALAALTAFAGAASAQSSVTLYGRVDLSIGKPMGTENKGMFNGSGSRLGFRGVEDLGGGMAAIFNIEHRFNADTGQDTNTRFWHGRSFVGLKGGFGQIVFGREYAPAFLGNQLLADPWGWDTVAANGLIAGLGGIAKVRNDSAITYTVGAGGFSFGAQIAEGSDSIVNYPNRPVNFNVGYAGGPLRVSFGYEKTGRESPAGEDEKMWSVLAVHDMGFMKPSLWYGRGDAINGAEHKGWLLGLTAPIGAGELKASYGNLKSSVVGTVSKQMGIGYHYAMSKRTTLYVDFARDGERANDKTGYDVGIKHNF